MKFCRGTGLKGMRSYLHENAPKRKEVVGASIVRVDTIFRFKKIFSLIKSRNSAFPCTTVFPDKYSFSLMRFCYSIFMYEFGKNKKRNEEKTELELKTNGNSRRTHRL